MTKMKIALAVLGLCTVALAQDSGNAQTQPLPTRTLRIRISSGVLRGIVDRVAVPSYPTDALKSGIHGTVTFIVIIDETGKVVTGTPVEGDALLISASVEALRDFHFRPYMLNGTPVQVESQVSFHFSVRGKGEKEKGQTEYSFDIPYRPEFRPGAVDGEGKLTLWPRAISCQEPQLPADLAGKSGSVYLSITIGLDGKVQDVKVLGGDAPFVEPVLTAVRQCVYEPKLSGGKPTVSKTDASYHFGPRN